VTIPPPRMGLPRFQPPHLLARMNLKKKNKKQKTPLARASINASLF